MKLFALVVVLALAQVATADLFHASCELEVTASELGCADLKEKIEKAASEGIADPKKGLYKLESTSSDTTVVSRQTASKQYTDDVTLTYPSSGSTCTFKARSQSRVLSYYDFSTNYCNMVNMFDTIGFKYEKKIVSCKFHDDSKCLPAEQLSALRQSITI